MKNIFLTTITLWNGTIPVKHIYSSFLDKDIAEKSIEAVKKANDDIDLFSITYDVEEVTLYENELEVPILNPTQEQNLPYNTAGLGSK